MKGAKKTGSRETKEGNRRHLQHQQHLAHDFLSRDVNLPRRDSGEYVFIRTLCLTETDTGIPTPTLDPPTFSNQPIHILLITEPWRVRE